jgi:mRNA-degrading endonuclease RelE of RelBE toxin-antitoxin system
MTWTIAVAKRCRKNFEKALKSGDPGIRNAIKALQTNPKLGTKNKLHGALKGFYKIRKDPWRIVYLVDSEKKLVIIGRIGTRDDVYHEITEDDFIL